MNPITKSDLENIWTRYYRLLFSYDLVETFYLNSGYTLVPEEEMDYGVYRGL
jgi:hypothetical protein